jgi:hypothetical protein
MSELRATVDRKATSSLVRSPSPNGPPSFASLVGRLFGLSFHALQAVIDAVQRFAVVVGRVGASHSAQSTDEFQRALDWMRQDIRRGSKRVYRELSHAANQAAEQRTRQTRPMKPAWTTQAAPWARHWGLILPRGRRRTRAWT